MLDGAAPRADATDDELRQAARESLAKGASKRDAAAAVADVFAVSRKRVYDLVITLQA